MRWLVLRDSLDEMYNFPKKDVRFKGHSKELFPGISFESCKTEFNIVLRILQTNT